MEPSMDSDDSRGHPSEADRATFSSIADKFWDLANNLTGVAVVQTIVFLFALGTSQTLVAYVNCNVTAWCVATALLIAMFGLYLTVLHRYQTSEDQLRKLAA